MYRYTGALRYVSYGPRRLTVRSRLHSLPPKLDSVALVGRSRHYRRPTSTVVFCHLHHDARRRRTSIGSIPIVPYSFCLSTRDNKVKVWDTVVPATVAIPVVEQRMAFSSSGSPPSGRRRYPSKDRRSTNMDEGTRKSIRQSDEKDKKSMRTVKVRVAFPILSCVGYCLQSIAPTYQYTISNPNQGFQ